MSKVESLSRAMSLFNQTPRPKNQPAGHLKEIGRVKEQFIGTGSLSQVKNFCRQAVAAVVVANAKKGTRVNIAA